MRDSERRSRRRYVTLKNAGFAGIAAIVAVLLLSFWSAIRPDSPASGSLYPPDRPASPSISVRHDPMIVTEGSGAAYPETSTLLLDARAQDQLRAPATAPAAQTAPAAADETNFEPRTSQLGKGKRITISGGREGIQIHAEPMPVPAPPPASPTATSTQLPR